MVHSRSEASRGTNRQLKLLFLVLTLSNVGLGLFSVHLLRKLDRQYTELIGRNVPMLNSLQTLTARSVEAMRGTGPALLDASADRRPQVIQQGQAAVRTDRELREQILARHDLVSAATMAELADSGQRFAAGATEVFRLAAMGDLAAARAFRDTAVRPAYDRYLAAITATADALEAESLRANETFSERTGTFSTWVLGVASWPVIVLGIVLLIIGLAVASIMVVFRSRQTSDSP